MPNLIEILEIMRKPIEYATREQFAHFKKVQAIDSFLNGQIEAALKSTRSASQRYEIQRLQTLLKNYQQFSEQDRKQCLLRAKGLLEDLIRKLDKPADQVSDHTSQVPGHMPERATCNVQQDLSASGASLPFEWTAPVQYIKGV